MTDCFEDLELSSLIWYRYAASGVLGTPSHSPDSSVRVFPQGTINGIRNAKIEAPQLLAARAARKAGQNSFPRDSDLELQFSFEQVHEATIQSWSRAVTSVEFEEKLGASACNATSHFWALCCREHLTDFSIGVATQAGFQAAIAERCTEALEQMVAAFLERKLVRQGHKAWQQGARSGGPVPLWRAEEEVERSVSAASFDCVIVEPFNPHWDPTFLLEPAGQRRIAKAVRNLASWTSQVRDEDLRNSLFAELEKVTCSQQLVLRAAQDSVQALVASELERIIHRLGLQLKDLMPFGSAELGTATVESDVDFAAMIHTELTPYSLVHYCKEALEDCLPEWMCPGTLNEVLQTAKVPILSFDVLLPMPITIPETTHLNDILSNLGVDRCIPDVLEVIHVDICFNNNFAALETQFYRSLIQSSSTALQLLIWLKHWTKSVGVNEPKSGSLSSFGWRSLLLAILMEHGVVPCLRHGFANIENALRVGGLNMWWQNISDCSQVAATVDTWSALNVVISELQACVGSNEMRVFQLVTSKPDLLDQVVGEMDAGDTATRVPEDVSNAIHSLPRTVRLLLCDVDGVLFRISAEMLATELEDTSDFFFNTRRSVPEHVEPLIFDFLRTAAEHGFCIAVVSGRDEAILPEVQLVVQRPQQGTCIRPFLYMFKPYGSRAPTVEHKARAAAQILQCCALAGKTVESLVIIDDMEPHMAGFLDGAKRFGVPTFAINSFERPGQRLALRQHNPNEKHMVVLAFPQGSGKMEILQEVCARYPSARLVVWEGANPEEWNELVGRILHDLNTPGVRFILIKMAPDLEKIKKLALFLGHGGSILSFYQAHRDDATADISTRLSLLSHLRAVLMSNDRRCQIGGHSMHIPLPEGLDLWPPSDSRLYRRWADAVWAGRDGLVRTWDRLQGKARRCTRLTSEHTQVRSMRCISVERFLNPPNLQSEEITELSDMFRLLNERRAAERRGADVVAMLNKLRQATGIAGIAWGLRRDAVSVAEDICRELHRVASTPSSLPVAGPLDDDLLQFLT